MTPVFAARRRAEEFNLLVEDTSTGDLRDARYVEFLELVGALRETPRVEARPEFVASLRERLMAEAEVALAKVPTTPASIQDRLTVAPRRTARERRFAVAVGGFAIVGATTSMAVAAQSALPGDMLYPLKRAIENAHTGFSVDDSSKGSTLLANATGRLDEVDALTRKGAGHSDADTIADTLGTFSAQASEASDLLIADYQNTGRESSIAELRDFAASAMVTLSDLESVVPDAARGALITAAQILVQIDTQAQSLCPSCGGARIDVVPPFVLSTADDLLNNVASVFTVPDVQESTQTGHKTKHPGRHHDGPSPVQETDDVTGAEAPTSVLNPPDSSGDGVRTDDQTNDQTEDPLGDLTDVLSGGSDTSTSNDGPTGIDPVDGLLNGVGDTLDDVLGGTTQP